nr:type II secretion system F family protein [Brevibacterium daeguense]
MLLLGVLAVSASCALAGLAVISGFDGVHRRSVANLRRGETRGAASSPAEKSALSTARQWFFAVAFRLTPRSMVRRLEGLLTRAGRPPKWPLQRLVAAKPTLAVIAGGLSLLILLQSPGARSLLLGLAVATVAYFLPELLLYSRGKERRQQIGLDLADTLDQMTIAVEAGLGFDGAMSRAGKNGTGPLAEELVRTLQDIKVGRSRRQAYEELAVRTDVPDLRRFIRAIVQADMYGIAVADVLRTQAAEMRMKRRQRAEEKAMQIPVKVIFPLMLCILPVLFIVILGPTVINAMGAFG